MSNYMFRVSAKLLDNLISKLIDFLTLGRGDYVAFMLAIFRSFGSGL